MKSFQEKVNDIHNLERFIEAQKNTYHNAYEELCDGKKKTHWMWFIFPQVEGLGASPTSKFYSIKSKKEALEYLEHPVLGERLKEITKVLLSLSSKSPKEIFKTPDDIKLKSCMTLFSNINNTQENIFAEVLQKYFKGENCTKTIEILKKEE